MAIKTTIDSTTYSGVDTIVAGGKTINLEETGVIDTPTATKEITANGTGIDVTNYAKVNVAVPTESSGDTPTGTVDITENGTTDVSQYAYANVNVPIPDGYVKPDGTLDVTANGTVDVTNYKSVAVAVPTVSGDEFTLSATSTKAQYKVGTDASDLSLVVIATFANGDVATFDEWDATGAVAEGVNQFTISAGGKTCVVEVNGVADETQLPDGYELCEYVQTSLSEASYFTIPIAETANTAYSGKLAATNLNLLYSFTENAGVKNYANNVGLFYGIQGSSTGYYGMLSNTLLVTEEPFEFYLSSSKASVGTEELTFKKSASLADYSESITIGTYMAGSVRSTNGNSSRIYSFKIYNGDDVVCNLIPCLDASSKPCLYDTIGGTSYYSTNITYKLATED